MSPQYLCFSNPFSTLSALILTFLILVPSQEPFNEHARYPSSNSWFDDPFCSDPSLASVWQYLILIALPELALALIEALEFTFQAPSSDSGPPQDATDPGKKEQIWADFSNLI